MTTLARDEFVFRLQVGRRLRGRLLALTVLLRELPLMLWDGFGSQKGAPEWIVVEDRASGRQCWRVSAGRDYGAGEHILAQMQTDADVLTEDEFAARWRK